MNRDEAIARLKAARSRAEAARRPAPLPVRLDGARRRQPGFGRRSVLRLRKGKARPVSVDGREGARVRHSRPRSRHHDARQPAQGSAGTDRGGGRARVLMAARTLIRASLIPAGLDVTKRAPLRHRNDRRRPTIHVFLRARARRRNHLRGEPSPHRRAESPPPGNSVAEGRGDRQRAPPQLPEHRPRSCGRSCGTIYRLWKRSAAKNWRRNKPVSGSMRCWRAG